ncbi:hypothetical protein [Methylorubrum extorquens]|uniref:hypothetical protein n=1 Tax=Methylorubrum extorquens TaxID=408 RepID=UPI001EE5359E|nr:hypothetical protein [Methylorubrum extorquens]MCG5245305.1 hypothetical protein [Methylorubrum extorquens]
MGDLFNLDCALTPGERRHLRGGIQAKGYAAMPGTGPKGETCAHLVRKCLAEVYRKCALMERHWTGGKGPNVLTTALACRKWKAALLTARGSQHESNQLESQNKVDAVVALLAPDHPAQILDRKPRYNKHAHVGKGSADSTSIKASRLVWSQTENLIDIRWSATTKGPDLKPFARAFRPSSSSMAHPQAASSLVNDMRTLIGSLFQTFLLVVSLDRRKEGGQ